MLDLEAVAELLESDSDGGGGGWDGKEGGDGDSDGGMDGEEEHVLFGGGGMRGASESESFGDGGSLVEWSAELGWGGSSQSDDPDSAGR